MKQRITSGVRYLKGRGWTDSQIKIMGAMGCLGVSVFSGVTAYNVFGLYWEGAAVAVVNLPDGKYGAESYVINFQDAPLYSSREEKMHFIEDSIKHKHKSAFMHLAMEKTFGNSFKFLNDPEDKNGPFSPFTREVQYEYENNVWIPFANNILEKIDEYALMKSGIPVLDPVINHMSLFGGFGVGAAVMWRPWAALNLVLKQESDEVVLPLIEKKIITNYKSLTSNLNISSKILEKCEVNSEGAEFKTFKLAQLKINNDISIGKSRLVFKDKQKLEEVVKKSGEIIKQFNNFVYKSSVVLAIKDSLDAGVDPNNKKILELLKSVGIDSKQEISEAKVQNLISDVVKEIEKVQKDIEELVKKNAAEIKITRKDILEAEKKAAEEQEKLLKQLDAEKAWEQKRKAEDEKANLELQNKLKEEQEKISKKVVEEALTSSAVSSSSAGNRVARRRAADTPKANEESNTPVIIEQKKPTEETKTGSLVSSVDYRATLKVFDVEPEKIYKVKEEKKADKGKDKEKESKVVEVDVSKSSQAVSQKRNISVETIKSRLSNSIKELKSFVKPKNYETELLPSADKTFKDPALLANVARTSGVLLLAIEAIDQVWQLGENTQDETEKQTCESFRKSFYPYRNHIVKQLINTENGNLYFSERVGVSDFVQKLEGALESFSEEKNSDVKKPKLLPYLKQEKGVLSPDINLRNIVDNYSLCRRFVEAYKAASVDAKDVYLQAGRFALVMLAEGFKSLTNVEKNKSVTNANIEIKRGVSDLRSFAEANSYLVGMLEEMSDEGLIKQRNALVHKESGSVGLANIEKILKKLDKLVEAVEKGLSAGKERGI